jgi:hypothetical protein
VGDARALLDRIPDDARVMASNRLAPHLTGRADVTVLGWPAARPNPDWILVDNGDPIGFPLQERSAQESLVEAAKEAGYTETDARGDFVLFHRPVVIDGQFPPLPEPER